MSEYTRFLEMLERAINNEDIRIDLDKEFGHEGMDLTFELKICGESVLKESVKIED